MKKFLSLVLSICMLLSVFTGLDITAFAATSGTCGDNLTWTFDSDTGTLTINGSGAMKDYGFSSLSPWYSFCTSIVDLEILGNVTSIGSYAFKDCSSLTEIILPDSLTYIGYDAFYKCSSLTEITLPDSLTNIREYAFTGCSSLTEITLPDSLTNIGRDAFSLCSSLTEIILPDGLTNIGDGTFNCCTSLTEITLPDSLTSIEGNAFYKCSSLTEIILPYGLINIGYSAFSGCTSLTEIILPDSLTNIGSSAFYNCSSLTEITLPEGLTNIGDGTFNRCTSLTEITLPDSLTNIGSSAFCDCSSLTEITLPDSLTNIGKYAFEECTSLTEIILPEGLTNIGDYTFAYCTSLTEITLPDSLTNIGKYAFEECTSLKEITIPQSVLSIGTNAFENTGLKETYYKGTADQWAEIDFSNSGSNPVSSSNNLYINNELLIDLELKKASKVSNYAFIGCESLTSVSIPESVKEIGDGAFEYCTNLNDVTISNGVEIIEDYAFYGTGISSVTIPSSVKNIGSCAFNNCKNLNIINYASTKSDWNAINEVGSINWDTMVQCTDGGINCNHQLVTINGYPETCDTDGLTDGERCSVCGEITLPQVVINAHNNVIIDEAVDVTCTESGFTQGSHCGVCEKVFVAQIETKPHGYAVIDEEKPVSCTQDGLTQGSHCSYCGKVIVAQEVVPAHHTIVTDEAVEATCCSTGLTEGSHCSVCGNVFVSQTVIPMNNHIVVTDPAVAPTCKSTGLTEGSHCSACNKVLTSQTVVPVIPCQYAKTVTPASPLSSGYTTYTCTMCGDSYVQDYNDFEYGICDDYGICSDVNKPVVNWYYFADEGLLYFDGDGAIKNYSNTTSTPWYKYIDNIRKIIVGADVESLGTHSFASCQNLESFEAKSCIYFNYDNGAIYSDNNRVLEFVLPLKNKTTYKMPDSFNVQNVKPYAFESCKKLKSITISETVQIIGESVFYDCSSLETLNVPFIGETKNADCKVLGWFFGDTQYSGSYRVCQDENNYYIPNSLKTVSISEQKIGKSAFQYCSSLQTVNARYLEYIGDVAFSRCTSLVNVPNLDDVKRIGFGAFEDCSSIKSITLPENVILDSYAFSNNTGLETITVPDSLDCRSNPFEGSTNIKTVNISYSSGTIDPVNYVYAPWYISNKCSTINIANKIDSIAENAFCDVVTIKSITFPSSLKYIGDNAFSGCYGITSLNFNAVKVIGDGAFEDCFSLTSLDLNSIEYIGESAFANCDSVKSIDIGKKITVIEARTFENCSSIQNLVIPDSVKEIGVSAFSDCEGITSYTAPVHLEYKNNSFEGVTNIVEVTLTKGKGIMPDFTSTASLPWKQSSRTCKKINLGMGIDNIGNNAFSNMIFLETMTIPEDVVYIGKEAFSNCSRLGTVVLLNRGINIYDNAIPTFVTICSYNNSGGEAYAKRNGNLFVSLGNYECKVHNYVESSASASLSKNGTKTSTCMVCGKVVKTTIYKPATFKLSTTSYVYDGKAKTPTVTVKDSNGKTLVKNTDYTLTYGVGRKNVGKYSVKIDFKGKYTGSKTLYFTIVPKTTSISSVTAQSKGFTVKWKKQATQTTGYQIQYSTSSNFKSAKLVTVGKNTTLSKKVTKLKGKKKYYIRVRTYKTVNGTKYYSAWSKTKTVTTKK